MNRKELEEVKSGVLDTLLNQKIYPFSIGIICHDESARDAIAMEVEAFKERIEAIQNDDDRVTFFCALESDAPIMMLFALGGAGVCAQVLEKWRPEE